MSDRAVPRLFVDADLEAGAPVGLPATQAHYLRSVLRLPAGTVVHLFNGRDGEWSARIDGIGKGWASVLPSAPRRPQEPPSSLWLAFAPVKKSRLDFIVEKATELGVGALQPVLTRRTDVARVNIDRLRVNAVEAAEQCERLDVPAVRDPVPLERFLSDWPANRLLLACAEAGGVRPMANVAADLAGRAMTILVGPEGGFDAAELDGLRDLPFCRAVGLGPRVLRTETAATAALAIVQALAGDGAARPHGRAD